MTATGKADAPSDGPGDGDAVGSGDSAADHEYFRALEDLFIRLRGSPLLLSPADWQVARRWRRLGVPLGLAGRVMSEVFEKRKERGGDDRPVSLRYFRRPVEGAWKAAREMAAAGEREEAEAFDLAGRLDRLAAALPADWPERSGWVDRITALGAADGDEAPGLEDVESALESLDRELLAAAGEHLGQADLEALEAEVERSLERVAAQLPDGELERSRKELHRRRLRARQGLPLLSLFAPEAEGG